MPRAEIVGVLHNLGLAPDATTLIAAVKAGLDVRAFADLARRLGVSDASLAEVAGIAPTTLGCRKRAGALTPDESEHVLRLAALLEHATNVFEDDGEAADWLRTPNLALGGFTPLALETLAHADRRRFERDYVAIEVRVPPDLVLELRDDDVPGDWRARPTSWSARASARFTSALPDDSASTSASRLVERQPFRGRAPEDRAEVAPMMPVTLIHDLWERLLGPAGLALQRGDVPCRARSVRRARYARRPIQVSSGMSTRRSRG